MFGGWLLTYVVGVEIREDFLQIFRILETGLSQAEVAFCLQQNINMEADTLLEEVNLLVSGTCHWAVSFYEV